VAFSPDGKTFMTGCQDKTTQRWNVATGRPQGAPLLHPYAVTGVAFRPGGRILATCCADGTARFWDLPTGKPVGPPLLQSVTAQAFRPGGRALATGSAGGVVEFWAVPAPVGGDVPSVLRSTRDLTAAELDAGGALRELNPPPPRPPRPRPERPKANPPP
jgi:WD40 repeat protein